MNKTEIRLIRFAVQHLELGKPDQWIVDSLVQQERMARPIALLLVARVARELEARSRRRRRLGRIGLVLLAASVIPWFLGMRGRGASLPLWPGLFPEGSNWPYLLLLPALAGAFLFFNGLPGPRLRARSGSPHRLPPGQIPPGWPGPGAPELPPQQLPPGQIPPGWATRPRRDPDPLE